MYRRHELARHKTQQDAGREVVFANSIPEFEVRLEHGAERERNGLESVSINYRGNILNGVP
jgi:hypothetical protein